jgi:peptidoglycan/xylan/chitin deacetylase (PgdA/CDA1 family)
MGLGCAANAASAGDCPGNPDALGTERVLVVDPMVHRRVGTMQYHESLPLADKEVVLTFDDGPLPPYTDRILQSLAAECVKATFFMVGRQAQAFPAAVRRVYNEGHTVASHSQNHPRIFTRLRSPAAAQEVELGIQSVHHALGDPNALSPFFRFPGLGRSQAIESYLAGRGMMTWSADFLADDWTHISAQQVLHRALERLEKKGKGILLLHDIQPATALMLPHLLRELKARGYRVVHVVPAGVDRPATVTEPESWVMHRPAGTGWPVVLDAGDPKVRAPSAQSFGWPHPFRAKLVRTAPESRAASATDVEQLGPPAAGSEFAADPAMWSRAVDPVPPFGLPPRIGEFSLAAQEPDAALVAPRQVFENMVRRPTGRLGALKPAPLARSGSPPKPPKLVRGPTGRGPQL